MLLRGIIGLAALAVLAGAAVFCAVCVCAAKKRPAVRSDCLIVLGAKVRPDGSMSDSLRFRCESALSAWQKGVAENIIVCGGRGPDEPVEEAAVMAAWLTERGVPGGSVLTEAASTDTRENIANAAKIMLEHGWKRAAVVTSDYHVQRALWLAADGGIDASGIAAESPQSAWGFFRARVRETCSWVLYGFRQIF